MATNRPKKISISLLIPFAIVALVFGSLIWKKMQDSREPHPVPKVNEPAADRKGVLFFVADGTKLAREARELPLCSDTETCVKDLLDELFSGPVGDLDEALPGGLTPNNVHLEGNLAIIDVPKAFTTDLPIGSSAEMLAVYSIINTICFNYPQIARVKITVEGETPKLNHLDLTAPLLPDYSLESDAAPAKNAVSETHPVSTAKKGHP